jgi:MGT family glycosyltransferase
MTTKHVAILMFPGWGHVNPTLEISRLLVSVGHRVTYVVDERFADACAATGARVVEYASGRGRLPSGPVTADDMSALSMSVLRDSIEVVLPRMLEAFTEPADIPDLILYDLESFAAARAAARRWGRPTAQLFPYVATNEEYSLAAEVFAGAGESFGEVIERVAGFLEEEGEEPAALWSFLSNFDDRNIVLLPREQQPHGETFDERYTFVGHSLPAYRPGAGSWSPPDAGRVALVTLGTEVNDRPDFFARCGDAFAGGDWHLVIAAGPGNLPDRPPRPHVEMHEWLDFETVLPHVSAVVCHSGMSTILDAVSFAKPVVVVTYTPEDRVNARRITELGAGLEVPGEEATADRLREAVETVAGDPEIQRRVAALRVAVLAAGGPPRAVQVIDGWLNDSEPTSGATMKHTESVVAR